MSPTPVITSAPSRPRVIARTNVQRVQRQWRASGEPVLVPVLAARILIGVPAQIAWYFLALLLAASTKGLLGAAATAHRAIANGGR
ncbi:hypothetical protein [Natronoglycomyces albus]|uniref:Uncharacterized protein n=1 Tax=Natronoglycomyces albus TaxID=2811108 RepID=A0A895XNB7_9ACTN|nr:hypothetical protein [Natronoglycomyces albus]QSB07141.1 hypothetical protein JQS30_16820 [Natronoglycomyces albus]